MFAHSRFLRLCVRRSFIIWYDWGGWWNQLWLLSGHKFSYCAVVSKNGFCCTDLFLQEFFFTYQYLVTSPFLFFFPFIFFFYFSLIFLFFSSLLLFLLLLWSKARIFRWWFALLWVSESSIRHWRKKYQFFLLKVHCTIINVCHAWHLRESTTGSGGPNPWSSHILCCFLSCMLSGWRSKIKPERFHHCLAARGRGAQPMERHRLWARG